MIRKNFILFCMFMLVMFVLPGSSFAAFGVYTDLGSGSGTLELDSDDYEYDFDTSLIGFGFQLETSPVTRGKLFSYRFQVGIESRDMEFEGVDPNLELYGLLVKNTFAFGGNVSDKIRLWAGPEISCGIYGGGFEEGLSDDPDFVGFLYGFGVAGGANFALGDGKPIISATVGIRSVGMAGVFSYEDDYYDDDDDDVTTSGSEAFLSVSIMF